MEYDFRTKITSLLAVLAVIFCATFAIAQGIVTGSVSGTVEDPQGAVVSGAKVTAKHLATNREFNAVTAAGGNFSLRTNHSRKGRGASGGQRFAGCWRKNTTGLWTRVGVVRVAYCLSACPVQP